MNKKSITEKAKKIIYESIKEYLDLGYIEDVSVDIIKEKAKTILKKSELNNAQATRLFQSNVELLSQINDFETKLDSDNEQIFQLIKLLSEKTGHNFIDEYNKIGDVNEDLIIENEKLKEELKKIELTENEIDEESLTDIIKDTAIKKTTAKVDGYISIGISILKKTPIISKSLIQGLETKYVSTIEKTNDTYKLQRKLDESNIILLKILKNNKKMLENSNEILLNIFRDDYIYDFDADSPEYEKGINGFINENELENRLSRSFFDEVINIASRKITSNFFVKVSKSVVDITSEALKKEDMSNIGILFLRLNKEFSRLEESASKITRYNENLENDDILILEKIDELNEMLSADNQLFIQRVKEILGKDDIEIDEIIEKIYIKSKEEEGLSHNNVNTPKRVKSLGDTSATLKSTKTPSEEPYAKREEGYTQSIKNLFYQLGRVGSNMISPTFKSQEQSTN